MPKRRKKHQRRLRQLEARVAALEAAASAATVQTVPPSDPLTELDMDPPASLAAELTPEAPTPAYDEVFGVYL